MAATWSNADARVSHDQTNAKPPKRDEPALRAAPAPPDALDESPMALDDVRAIARMLGEIAAMTEGLGTRRAVLMDRLTRLVNATGWVWTTTTGFGPGETPMAVSIEYGGFTERQIGLIVEASQDTKCPMPENPPITEALTAGKHLTRSRSDLVSD